MPEHIPNDQHRARARALAAIGMDVAGIGVLLDLSTEAVREHYAAELRAGPAEAAAKVREALFAAAVRGDRLALKLWRANGG